MRAAKEAIEADAKEKATARARVKAEKEPAALAPLRCQMERSPNCTKQGALPMAGHVEPNGRPLRPVP
jgi:hypothetical protein